MKIHWHSWGQCWMFKKVKTTRVLKRVTCGLCKAAMQHRFVLQVADPSPPSVPRVQGRLGAGLAEGEPDLTRSAT